MAAAANKATVENVYKLFAEGKIPEIIELHDPASKVSWLGDKGREEFVGMAAFAEGVISRLPKEWPTFKIEPIGFVLETETKFIMNFKATTDNGMDTIFMHYYEFNADGKIIQFDAMDDGAAFLKYKVEAPAAE